jgi:hypothetical protein
MERNTNVDKMSEDRRQFFGAAAIAVAATQIGWIGSAEAQPRKTKPANLPKIRDH